MDASTKVVKNSVAFIMPCAGPMDPRTMQCAVSLAAHASANGFPVTQVGITERVVIDSARNTLAREFLKTDCEWAFWMDSDMILPTETLAVLMRWAEKLKGKILTGIYYQRQGQHRPLALRRTEVIGGGLEADLHAFDGDPWAASFLLIPHGTTVPIEVDRIGFGVVLTHRSVFEELPEPWFKLHWYRPDKQVSEDFYFCKNAREAGFKIWAIPELKCGHIATAPVITEKDFKYDEKDMRVVRIPAAHAGD